MFDNKKVFDLIEDSAVLAAKTKNMVKQAEADKRAYEAFIPKAVDGLIRANLVQEKYRSKLAEQLKDPEEALKCIVSMSKKATSNSVVSYGRPAADTAEYTAGKVSTVWDRVARSKSGCSR